MLFRSVSQSRYLPTVGGYLYLSSLTSIPEGFNPTVGGWLDLRSLTSIPEGFNPTVGGDLDLGSLTSILYKDYLLRLRNTYINERSNLLQDYRREVEQKLQQQGLELKETQMYFDMIFKTLGMGNDGSYTEDYDGSEKSYTKTIRK